MSRHRVAVETNSETHKTLSSASVIYLVFSAGAPLSTAFSGREETSPDSLYFFIVKQQKTEGFRFRKPVSVHVV